MVALSQDVSTSIPESTSQTAFFAFPESLSPLPPSLGRGLLALGTFGIVSAAFCIGMLSFFLYRFLTWRAHYTTAVKYNQYLVLIVNLLAADLLQGCAFMLSFHWIYNGGILAPTIECTSQGFLLNTGDLASGFFVLGVALHTFYGAVKGRHIKHGLFFSLVAGAWLLALFLSAMGPIMHGKHYYVRANAWCWANPKYENERLSFHYIWIFIVQFGTIVIYLLIFLHLKNTLHTILPASQSITHSRVDRAARLMLLFPAAYIIITMPLTAGRMWNMTHHSKVLPESFYLITGSMVGSSGIVDCLLYTLTRRSLVQTNNGKTTTTLVDSYDLSHLNGITQTRTVTVTGGHMSLSSGYRTSEDSTRSIISSPQKKYTLRGGHLKRTDSGSESLEKITGAEGLDPRKGEHKVQISTYETETGDDGSVKTSETSEGPITVMKGLAKLAMPSKK